MTVNHDVAGSSPAGGAKKRAGMQKRTCSFLYFAMLGLNRQDIMIAQQVALSNVCEANLPLSEAKQCRWFKPSRGSHRYRTILQPVAKSLVLQGFFVFLEQKIQRKK